MEDAACRGFPTALFFPAEHDDDQSDGDNEIAKQICAGCPVQDPCRESQLAEPYGVRGALTAEDRGYGRRGKMRPGQTSTLRETVRDVLRANPDVAFTADSLNRKLLEQHGRAWPRNSLNAALLHIYREGLAERSHDANRILTYQLKETHD